MSDEAMKPRGGTGTFDGLNFAAANFETRANTTTANTTAAAVKEEEESKERRADKRGKHRQHTATQKHITYAAHTNTTRRPLTPNHTHPPQLRIDLFPSIVTGGGGTAGAEGVSVSHVSKNGVSFFPHFSFNDEGKEGGEEEGEEVSARMEGEGETDRDEKSRVSSTEMDDDISIRYTTPTMASNHIMRPLPSPSSLSVPQPSIGSGIGSSVEHSMIGSVGMPYKGRMGTGREGSAFFPSVFSPKGSVNSPGSADMYGEDGIASSPLSGYASAAATAASPPSTTSPLSPNIVSPLPVFPRPHETGSQPRHLSHPSLSVSAASTSTSSLYHPTTTILSPPPPPGDHLILNTHAIALASQLFDDSELTGHSTATGQHVTSLQRQRSPRHSMQRVGSMPGALRAPSTTSSQATSGSPPASSPHSPDASVLSTAGMYRHTSQPSPTEPHALATHISQSSTFNSSTQHQSTTAVDDQFSEPATHSRAFTRPSLSTSSLHTPSYSMSGLRTQGSGQRSPIAPGRSGRERGKMGGDNRMSDGLYSVSHGSDVDEDGSVTLSSGGGVAGVEEEDESSASRMDSGRSREESRLKAMAATRT